MEAHNEERSRTAAFIALLIEDVIAARQRLTSSHTQSARRDVVRASLAAIEGIVWVMREHVRTALLELDQLAPVTDLAMRELSYSVSDSGQLVDQVRALPLLTSIRFVVSQAKIVSPEISVEFSTPGWTNLRRSVQIRNRITHPKPDRNLAISDDDLAAVGSGVSWLLATMNYVMASTNLTLTRYNEQLRELVQRLSAGDPDALAEYQAALQQSQEED